VLAGGLDPRFCHWESSALRHAGAVPLISALPASRSRPAQRRHRPFRAGADLPISAILLATGLGLMLIGSYGILRTEHCA
jgi:hypothetical protein